MVPNELILLTDQSLRVLNRCISENNGQIPPRSVLRQIIGNDEPVVHRWLSAFHRRHGSASATSDVIEAILQVRENVLQPEALFDLILSGPEVADVPTCGTLPTIHHLIHQAESEFLICDYAIFGARSVFQHLSEALDRIPSLRVRLILNVFPKESHGDGGDSFDEFRKEILDHHWLGKRIPEIYVDPRSASRDRATKASMHAKCFVADQTAALVTSANLTDAAHQKNIEAGIVVRYQPMVRRLVQYFNTLIEEGVLRKL